MAVIDRAGVRSSLTNLYGIKPSGSLPEPPLKNPDIEKDASLGGVFGRPQLRPEAVEEMDKAVAKLGGKGVIQRVTVSSSSSTSGTNSAARGGVRTYTMEEEPVDIEEDPEEGAMVDFLGPRAQPGEKRKYEPQSTLVELERIAADARRYEANVKREITEKKLKLKEEWTKLETHRLRQTDIRLEMEREAAAEERRAKEAASKLASDALRLKFLKFEARLRKDER